MPLHVTESCLVFARQLGDEVVLSGFNLGMQSATVDLPIWKLGIENAEFRCPMSQQILSAAQGVLAVTIESEQSLLLVN